MSGKELLDFDQKMAQNEYGAHPAQSQTYGIPQPQNQEYIPPPQQEYIPLPQPQSQPNQQPYSNQSQPYQQRQFQDYQQNQFQSQPLFPQNQNIICNQPINNNIVQNYVNPTQNIQMDVKINYNKNIIIKTSPKRLRCQMIIGILLLLSIGPIVDFLSYSREQTTVWIAMGILANLLNLIIGICMIMLTVQKKTTRTCCFGILSLSSLIVCLFIFSGLLSNGGNISAFYVIDILIIAIATSFNLKCKCCN